MSHLQTPEVPLLEPSTSQVQVTNPSIQEDVNIGETTIELSQIKVNKPLKKYGNQKGFGQTVIGLNRGQKRKCPKTFYANIFQSKEDSDKTKTISQIFVDAEVAERAMQGTKIKEQEVNVVPEIVPMQRIRDERINLETVKHYFESGAFLQVAQLEEAIVEK